MFAFFQTKMKLLLKLIVVLLIVGAHVHGVPLIQTTETNQVLESVSAISNYTNVAKNEGDNAPKANKTQDLETAASEDKEYIDIDGPEMEPEHSDHIEHAPNPHIDPNAIFGSVITPEAFQQYVNQYGNAYAPYLAAAAAYPTPLGYAPPPSVFQSPYVLQTGYEGFLVPSTSTDSTTSTTTSSSTSSSTTTTTASPNDDNGGNPAISPITIITNLISALAMSTVVRVILAMIGSFLMVFFGGAITSIICRFTPICNFTTSAVTYVKRDAAEHMGRVVAEGMTSERVRRTAEFVRNAIRKYSQLQKLMIADGDK